MLENYSRLNLYKHLLKHIELFDLIEDIYTESFNRNTLIHFFLDMYNDIKTTEAQYFKSTIDNINYDYDDEIYNEFKNSKISYQNKIEKIDVKKPGLFNKLLTLQTYGVDLLLINLVVSFGLYLFSELIR